LFVRFRPSLACVAIMKLKLVIRLVVVVVVAGLFASLMSGCMDSRRDRRDRGENPIIIGDDPDAGDPSDTDNSVSPPRNNGTGPVTPPPGDDCGGCPANQICSNGTCQNLPAGCPCPSGSYCNLSENRCVAGCLADTDCSAGRVCDLEARQCISGCATNNDCGANQVCWTEIRECVPRCTSNENCAFNEICGQGSYCHYGNPCGILYLCLQDCRGNTTCERQCNEQSPQDAKNKYATLQSCADQSTCGTDLQCLFGQCESEATTCFDGYVGCSQFLGCYLNCENDQCRVLCQIYARNTALDLYNDMVECGQNAGCQTFACLEERCPTQWNTCINDD
jgi:hypothetical protein